MNRWLNDVGAPTAALFLSASTLLCCALPALLVTLGAGAAMASLTANVPGLMWLSAHKNALFLIAGVLLAISLILRFRTRNAPCPVDPAQAAACGRLRRIGGVIQGIAVAAYLTGGFFAYFAADLLL
ncbi:MAG: hypothetical protein AAFU65_11735 [Pseudomonadota bacterium]